MHINYFGDAVTYIGLALITLNLVSLLIATGITVYFAVIEIPMLDKHLGKKYGNEFREYANHTKKFIPLIY